MNKSDLKAESLPHSSKTNYVSTLMREVRANQNLTPEEYYEKLELILIERAQCTCKQIDNSECQCFSIENLFILGQFYFDMNKFNKAYQIFDSIKHEHNPSLYQLGVILYDDLLDNDEIKNQDNWVLGFEYMLRLANTKISEHEKTLIHSAQYNVGLSYYQGVCVKQSDDEAEKWWLLAADDGDPKGCVSAMTALAFFYSRKQDSEYFDLNKAFFWHNEATGNGSLESQGALGAMYYHGIGIKKDMSAAYECLTNSSERGNVYSMGLLCEYYYKNKFFVKAFELSKKVADLSDVKTIAKETNCLKNFVAKGISLASFTQARCLDLGKGTEQNSTLAQSYYKRSFEFDPDLCQRLQNSTTLSLI